LLRPAGRKRYRPFSRTCRPDFDECLAILIPEPKMSIQAVNARNRYRGHIREIVGGDVVK
jgi:hypothetical protein